MKFLFTAGFWGIAMAVVGLFVMWKKEIALEWAKKLEGTILQKPAKLVVQWPFILVGVGLGLAIPSFIWQHLIAMAAISAIAFFVGKKLTKKQVSVKSA